MRTDRTIHVLLTAIAFLLGANLLVNLHQDRAAIAAGIPDSGAQAQQQIDQLVALNQKVERLQSFLEGGKLAVVVKEMPKAEK
jgi:hypothetical protein